MLTNWYHETSFIIFWWRHHYHFIIDTAAAILLHSAAVTFCNSGWLLVLPHTPSSLHTSRQIVECSTLDLRRETSTACTVVSPPIAHLQPIFPTGWKCGTTFAKYSIIANNKRWVQSVTLSLYLVWWHRSNTCVIGITVWNTTQQSTPRNNQPSKHRATDNGYCQGKASNNNDYCHKASF